MLTITLIPLLLLNIDGSLSNHLEEVDIGPSEAATNQTQVRDETLAGIETSPPTEPLDNLKTPRRVMSEPDCLTAQFHEETINRALEMVDRQEEQRHREIVDNAMILTKQLQQDANEEALNLLDGTTDNKTRTDAELKSLEIINDALESKLEEVKDKQDSCQSNVTQLLDKIEAKKAEIASAQIDLQNKTDKIQELKLELETYQLNSEEQDKVNLALWEAAEDGNLTAIEYALLEGAELEFMYGRYKHPPLSAAAEHGHVDAVKYLLEEGADVNSVGDYGRTPVYYAALTGQDDVIQVLLEAGGEVDTRSSGSWTPLMTAASGGHASTVRLLLEAGADIDATDKNGVTVYGRASGHIDVQKVMYEWWGKPW